MLTIQDRWDKSSVRGTSLSLLTKEGLFMTRCHAQVLYDQSGVRYIRIQMPEIAHGRCSRRSSEGMLLHSS